MVFLQRFNVFSFKLQRARSYLSLHNFKYAQYYLHSTRHDIVAMRETLLGATKALATQLVCSA